MSDSSMSSEKWGRVRNEFVRLWPKLRANAPGFAAGVFCGCVCAFVILGGAANRVSDVKRELRNAQIALQTQANILERIESDSLSLSADLKAQNTQIALQTQANILEKIESDSLSISVDLKAQNTRVALQTQANILERIESESLSLSADLKAQNTQLNELSRHLQQLGDPKTTASKLRQNVMTLGIRYTDTDQAKDTIWFGTGFALRSSRYCVTAAHVLEKIDNERRDYAKRDLHPEVIAKLPDGSIQPVVNRLVHSSFPGKTVREKALPTKLHLDIGIFEIEKGHHLIGLSLAREDAELAVGDEIVAAGFPTRFDYDTSIDVLAVPTVKYGHIERLTGFDVLKGNGSDILQHNLPLVVGFSGSPILDMHGNILGITTVSSHRFFKGEEVFLGQKMSRRGRIGILDPANINFAVHSNHLRLWLVELEKRSTADVEP